MVFKKEEFAKDLLSLTRKIGFRMHLGINSRIGGMSVKLGALRSRHL